jgi:C-terminal processing protease CtpA/Prc
VVRNFLTVAWIEIDAPTGPYQQWHFQVSKPAWRVIDGRWGYVSIPDTFNLGTRAIVEGMANLRGTKGLVLDLRGNSGAIWSRCSCSPAT